MYRIYPDLSEPKNTLRVCRTAHSENFAPHGMKSYDHMMCVLTQMLFTKKIITPNLYCICSKDATNNTSESINWVLKTNSSSWKKNVQTVFFSVYNFKIDRNSGSDVSEKCPRRWQDDLIQKLKRIKEVLAEYDNLPAEIRILSLSTYLDCLSNF